jgi:integrase
LTGLDFPAVLRYSHIIGYTGTSLNFATSVRPVTGGKSMSNLTASAIAAALPGQVLRDDIMPGLHVRCFPNRKSFYLYYRTRDGVERKPKLGDVGIITLAKARELAREVLSDVAGGGDPVAVRRAARTAPTVADLWQRYWDEHARYKKSASQYGRLWRIHVAAGLGNHRVLDVRYDDVHRLHRSLERTPYQANRVLALLSSMFALAERWGWRPTGSNPCQHVSRFRELKRRRYMTVAEAQAIAEGLRKHAATAPQSVAFLLLLMLTGARPEEIARAQWDWIRDGALHLPDSKTGRRTVFLPPSIVRMLNVLPRTGPTILSIKSPRNLWETLRKEVGCNDLRVYDLRHSFASVALSAGYTLPQIGELLGHSNPTTTARYAHLVDELAHKATADTAARMESMMGGLPDLSQAAFKGVQACK